MNTIFPCHIGVKFDDAVNRTSDIIRRYFIDILSTMGFEFKSYGTKSSYESVDKYTIYATCSV